MNLDAFAFGRRAAAGPERIADLMSELEAPTPSRKLSESLDEVIARRVAFLALRDPALAVRDLVARIRARGTVERYRYRTREDERGWDFGVELGVKLGADHHTSRLRRELVAAEILNGPVPAARYDCVGGP